IFFPHSLASGLLKLPISGIGCGGVRAGHVQRPLADSLAGSPSTSGVASTMADNGRAARIDHVALGLFVLGLVVSVAVFSFDMDSRSRPDNLLGEPGDWLAGELFET